MSITRIQNTNNTGNSSTASATYGSATTPGSFLAAIVTAGDTVTAPSGFSLAVGNTSFTDGVPIYIFYQANAPSISSVSATISGGFPWIMFIAEYSGLVTSSALDTTGSAMEAPGNTTQSGTIVTVYTNELIIAGLNNSTPGGFSGPTNSFNLVDATISFGAIAAAYLDFDTSGTGPYSTSCTTPTDGGNGVIASFRSTTSALGEILNAVWTGSSF